MRPTSTMTQRGFHPSLNWMESSHEAILRGSNLSFELLGEFGEETCLRAVFQGSWRYHCKPVRSQWWAFFWMSALRSTVLNKFPLSKTRPFAQTLHLWVRSNTDHRLDLSSHKDFPSYTVRTALLGNIFLLPFLRDKVQWAGAGDNEPFSTETNVADARFKAS